MDNVKTKYCITALNNGLNSIIGKSVVKYLEKYENEVDEIKQFLDIKNKLLNGKFKSIDNFMTEFKLVTFKLISLLGDKTEIGLCVTSVFQLVDQELDKIRMCSYESWAFKALDLCNNLSNIVKYIPDNEESFYKISRISFPKLPEPSSDRDIFYPKRFDLQKLSTAIHNLKREEDQRMVAMLLNTYDQVTPIEEEVQNDMKYFKINLGAVNPYILQLVSDYVDRCDVSTSHQNILSKTPRPKNHSFKISPSTRIALLKTEVFDKKDGKDSSK